MPQPAHPFESKNWDGGPCKGSINAVETCIVSSISALTRRSRKGARRDSGNKPRPFIILATMSEGIFSLYRPPISLLLKRSNVHGLFKF